MANKTARQKKLGPAPFASFEDLSEDLSSPESKGYQPMPEICEEQHRNPADINDTSASTSTAQTPTTPRIDVEQASSPSQAESGDSTPERELFDMDVAAAEHLTSAFLEGAADVDLRSSAEDMAIPYSSGGGSFKGRRSSRNKTSTLLAGRPAANRKISWDAGDVRDGADDRPLERKGSSGRKQGDAFNFACRDTRLSSISSNISATSGMSALSAFSVRRSPSPHRMQLETSFCGPKTVAAAAAKEAEDEEELVELEASRRPSLLNPYSWFGGDGAANSRSASPIGTPSSPNCTRAFMFKYATEPRSRPTSPMGWRSAAPSPAPSWAGEASAAAAAITSKWLASPRCNQRRASSPHRTLVETSFCGHMQMKVPADDEVEARGPSPMPSLGSLLSIHHPVKYATEPRSRPASPTSNRSFLSSLTTPVPFDTSRRGSQNAGRCPSPMIETSFCGPKQLARRESQDGEDARQVVKPSGMVKDEMPQGSLKPVRYSTEPRSRPVSPQPAAVVAIQQPAAPIRTTCLDSPVISRATRSPSPHMMRVETSFCGGKQTPQRQDSSSGTGRDRPDEWRREEENVTHVSVHPLPVKYATEPRSRPVSPCNHLSALSRSNCPTPELPGTDRRRSPSPHRMIVETSFYSSKLPVANAEPAAFASSPTHRQRTADQIRPATPVKYATEPRSRPVSPSVHLLSNHSTPGTERRHRSPSPHRTLVETSFCGAKQVARQESRTAESAVVELASASQLNQVDRGDDVVSNSSDSVSDLGARRHPLDDDRTTQNSSPSSLLMAAPNNQHGNDQFNTEWPDQSVSQFASTWPVQHMTTFELSDKKLSQGDLRSSSEETASPPSQHSNGHIAQAIAKMATASPGRPARQMPKPVACPKPPQSFTPQYDSSAPSSPLPSPALSRRMESASPSPSSPFPSRRTSFGGRFGVQGVVDDSPDHLERKSSVTTTKSGDLPYESDFPAPPSDRTDKKEGHKSRSVLSVLFGKKSGKNKNNKDQQDLGAVEEQEDGGGGRRNGQESGGNRMLSLPLASRDPSPGRSAGDSGQSGDDLDDGGEGFAHQVLDGGNESGDNMVESDPNPAAGKVQLPKEEIGLFHQDSLDEELPFVPTTLPIERPIAPLITPVRMRMSEVQTIATQRPRCSVSFVPRSIDEFVKIARTDSIGGVGADPSASASATIYGEIPKIKVSLPKPDREESIDGTAPPTTPPAIKVTSSSASVCSNWESFSEQILMRSHSRKRTKHHEDMDKGQILDGGGDDVPVQIQESGNSQQQQQPQQRWINVEELPEPVKEAKVIKVVGSSSSKIGQGVIANKEPPAGEEDADKTNLDLPNPRKDSVCSETALLREIDEAELEEDRPSPLPPPYDDEDDASVSIRERHSQSSSLVDLDSNMDDVEATVLARSNLLVAAPFGMDLDVHSNRNSIVTPSEVPSPDDLSISMTQDQ